MDARELRLGNLVIVNNEKSHPNIKDKPLVVTGIAWRECDSFPNSTHSIEVYNKENYMAYSQFNEFIEPIPLTEEWLIRMGFKYNNLGAEFGGFQHEKLGMSLFYEDACYIHDSHEGQSGGIFVNIKSVHSLQNLYYSLTGQELVIK